MKIEDIRKYIQQEQNEIEQNEIDMISSVCIEYDADSNIMVNCLANIRKHIDNVGILIMFNYGQSCGGDYCFYGIFQNNYGRHRRVDYFRDYV